MRVRFRLSKLPSGAGVFIGLAFAVVAIVVTVVPAHSAESGYGTDVPPPRVHLHNPGDRKSAQAVLAGGCFWGMELVFSHVKGVTNVVSGYAGGDKGHANYADSSSGRYGDVEAVRITYDPSKIGYGELLRIYFSVAHDPTEWNRQGPDVGPQYRSEIFAADADQARVAKIYIKQLDVARVFDKPVTTKVSVGESFFPAEAYHQNYAKRHPGSLYIRWNDIPKLRALEQRYPVQYSAHYADGGQLSSTEARRVNGMARTEGNRAGFGGKRS